ncbi:MAG: helix-turn-helix transcriptional regulator [Alphaproteobacteria bacterium]|nr:helix-turn-helix transcriptional regulator [Alphaproteobacteria bacterium]
MKENVRKYLGLKVRSLREAENMTQEDLASVCDVSWRTISNLERGTVVPDLGMIYSIARKFNVSIDELLGYQVSLSKSQSRIKKENKIIENIRKADDNLLGYIDEQLSLLLKHFHHG